VVIQTGDPMQLKPQTTNAHNPEPVQAKLHAET